MSAADAKPGAVPKTERAMILPIIAVVFLGSALVRGGLVAEAATNLEQETAAAIATEAREMLKSEPEVKAAVEHDCDAGALITDLKTREAEFERREADLNAREARLSVVEDRVETRIAALKQAKEDLDGTITRVDGAQSRDVERLVTMYSTMKPKRAGELFNEMDVAFASELLVRMKPEIAALVLANMEAEKAFTASLLIARRNQSAPKN